ncbi:DUF6262 family protein [Nocardia miyunensis]|uniref:DUF6262 family protein n=1 Tax=Nocardia miyunensis TaxID=282684 RepID=UPI000ABC953D|nr:DUF6262 family protein [Nocardia miyunensis]
MIMRADNTEHLRAAARQRHDATRAKALAALHELDQAGAHITFQSVAARAGVSRSWLYKQTDLQDEIRRIRTQRQPTTVSSSSKQPSSDESWQRRLELAHNRIKELSTEVKSLRTQLALAHGQRRADNITAATPPD